MGLIIFILRVCSTVGVLASSSRMLWCFARDRGVPFWRHFITVRNHYQNAIVCTNDSHQLDRRTSIPIYTIGFTTLVSVLLSFITLGSSVAFNNIVNLSVTGLYSSYLLSCALLLWRRLQRGRIQPYNARPTEVRPGIFNGVLGAYLGD